MDSDRKRELKQQYKEIKVEAGVYQIRNIVNNKVFIDSTRNLKTLNGKELQLKTGGFINRRLQGEWDQFGPEAFVIEILEVLVKPEEGYFDEKEALKKLEKRWIDKIQPFGERGYN